MSKFITTLDELMDYCFELSQGMPDWLRAEFGVVRGGLANVEISRLIRTIPLLPDSYLRVVERVDILGRSMRFIRFSPSGGGRDLITKLTHINDSVIAINDPANFLIIGGCDAGAIIVGKKGTQVEGVIRLSSADSSAKDLPLASDFGIFLINVGNLDRACRLAEGRGVPEQRQILKEWEDDLRIRQSQLVSETWTMLFWSSV